MYIFSLVVLLVSISGDFQGSLQVRDFQRAFDRKPSAGLFCDLWKIIASFREQSVSLPDVDLRAEFEKL
jgi:hypothetical protein